MAVPAYLICATPRSGSTLLCDLLKQTGVAGRPDSFYRPQSIADWVRRWDIEPGEGLEFERRYLAAAIRAGRGDTGMFGMRLNGPTLLHDLMPRLAGLFPAESTDSARIAAAFGTPLYIHLERRDRVAQAVSYAKAEQSGLWHRHAAGGERERVKPHSAPVYDAAQLKAQIAEAEEFEASWTEWSRAQGIVPLEITYEDLSADPKATLAKVLAALGRDPAIADSVAPQTARLADAQSREWAERFRSDTTP